MPNELGNITTPNIGSLSSSDGELDTSGKSDLELLNSEDDNADKDDSGDESDDKDDNKDSESSDGDEEADESSDEEGEEEEETEDEEDEEDDSKEDDKEDKETDANLYKSLKKKHPQIFKDFPELRSVIAKEHQYSQIFDTPADAKKADTRSGILDAVAKDIVSGTEEGADRFFKTVNNLSESALKDFGHTILPAIAKLNPELYGEVLLNPFRRAMQHYYIDAHKAGNKDLVSAIETVHELIADRKITDPLDEVGKPVKSKEAEELEKEKANFKTQRFRDFHGDAIDAAGHSLRNIIKKSLLEVKGDNEKPLSDFLRRTISKEIFDGVDKVMQSDEKHLKTIRSLYKQAESAGYNSDWKGRIISAYLSRAKQALAGVKSKALREAGLKSSEIKKEVRRLSPETSSRKSSSSTNKGEGIDWNKVDYSKTTDRDILNDKPVMKKG